MQEAYRRPAPADHKIDRGPADFDVLAPEAREEISANCRDPLSEGRKRGAHTPPAKAASEVEKTAPLKPR